MRYKLFNKDWDSSHSINLYLAASNLVLVIIVFILAFTNAKKNERIVLAPPSINKAYEIQWDHASVEYYKDMAVWLSGMIGAVTPQTAAKTAKTIEPFIAPNIRKAVTEAIHSSVALNPKSRYVAWFLPVDTIYEPQTRKIFIVGTLNTSLTSSKRNVQKVTYEFKFRMRDGKPEVTQFQNYEGDARTRLYLTANKERLQKEKQAQAQADRMREVQIQRNSDALENEFIDGQVDMSDIDGATNNSSQTQQPSQNQTATSNDSLGVNNEI